MRGRRSRRRQGRHELVSLTLAPLPTVMDVAEGVRDRPGLRPPWGPGR